jgi:hypothetical protein
MKVKAYLRVAKTKGPTRFKITASTRPNYHALETGGYQSRALPTAAFALTLDIPDTLFAHAEQVLADIELTEADVRVAAEVAS